MAYSVNWITKVISIPTADLTLVSGTRYSLNMSDFLAEARRLEWAFADGLWAPTIVDHTNTRFDFAGANYAPFDDLTNDYTVEFTGVATRVDLLGSNNDIIDVLIATGVSVVPSNSAGLQIVEAGGGTITEQDKLDIADRVWDESAADHLIPLSEGALHTHMVYDQVVHLDPLSANTGATFPVGTAKYPVNNLADAKDIADGHAMTTINIMSNLVIGAADVVSDYTFVSPDYIDVMVTLTAGCTTQNTRFANIIIGGTFNGKCKLTECTVLELTDFKGFMLDCVLADNVAIIDPAAPTLIYNCGAAKVSPAVELDLNSASVSVAGWKGSLKLINKTGTGTNYIEIMAGTVEIDSTCTAGTIIVSGIGNVIDNSGGGCTVILDNLLNTDIITDEVWAEIMTGTEDAQEVLVDARKKARLAANKLI